MSNQIVISSGAKVRSLEGVLTGTAGIVSSVPYGGPNGVATLDSSGKVPLSQLPASVITYLGTWNASTNTPTLTNGVGDTGDLYICNVAGTVNFGAGPIIFAVGDWVIYSGTTWEKSAGSSGTVTSVAVTESGDALTITGSPITTSGTINIGFAGTGTQYIKGDGTLATFPTTIDQAKRLITEVYNSTGATLTKGTVVYINGGQGNLPTVTKAQANSDATSAQTYGVVQSDITNMNNGFVVVFGSITDIDTQAYAVGTQLYLSGTTAGEWTSTKPSAPIHLVYVGIVVRSHPTQGVVEIRIQNGYELEELHDVAISAPVNNQGIFYNSSNNLWENKSIATALGYTPANDSLVVHLAGTETITGQKTFSTTLFGTDAEFSSSILSPIVSILDSSTYTKVVRLQTLAATNRDVYFPDLNGTVTLLEGTQTFTGNKTFSGDTIFNGGIDVNNSINLNSGVFFRNNAVGSTLYTNFSIFKDANLENLKYIFSTSYYSNLVFYNTANYTYQFPAASGTIALTSDIPSLTGYVPYTGATSNLDLGTRFLYAGAIVNTGGVYLSNYTTLASTVGSGKGGFAFPTVNQTQFWFDNGYSAKFFFAGMSADRTYTFQNSSGTIAFTSDIPSLTNYVTLNTLQTITGVKFFNAEASFDSNIVLTGGDLVIGNSGFDTSINTETLTASRSINFPNKSGVVAMTSDIPSLSGYVQGSGTTNYHAKFTASSTIGNSMLTDDGTTLQSIGATRSNLYLKAASSSYYSQLAFTNGSNGSFGGISYNNSGQYMQIEANSSEWLRLYGNGNLRLFSSSATDNGYKFQVEGNATISAANTTLVLDTTSTSYDASLRLNNNSSATQWGIIQAGPAAISGGGMNMYTTGAYPFTLGTNGSERMRITSSGNVGIGTTNPTRQLFVNSTAFFDNNGDGSTTNPSIAIGSTSVGLSYIGGGNLALLTGGSERMRIRSNGNKTFNGIGGQDQMFSNYARTGNGDYIDIDTESGGGNFMGILIAQNNYAYNAGYRTQGIYAIIGRGTTISVTTITSVNGPTGSSAMSITSPSTGIIRITNVGLYGDTSASWRGFV